MRRRADCTAAFALSEDLEAQMALDLKMCAKLEALLDQKDKIQDGASEPGRGK